MLEVKGVLMMANFSFYVATYLLPLFTICKYVQLFYFTAARYPIVRVAPQPEAVRSTL